MTRRERNEAGGVAIERALVRWVQAKQQYHEAAMGPQGRGRTCSDAEIATGAASEPQAPPD